MPPDATSEQAAAGVPPHGMEEREDGVIEACCCRCPLPGDRLGVNHRSRTDTVRAMVASVGQGRLLPSRPPRRPRAPACRRRRS